MDKADTLARPAPPTATRSPDQPPLARAVPVSVEGMSNRELLSHLIDSATLLAKKEIELAKAELKQDIKAEVGMAKGLGLGALCALCTVNLMLVASALALGTVVAEWAAALIVAAAVLAVGTVAGTVGWKKRVTNPMESTRRSLQQDPLLAKQPLTHENPTRPPTPRA